MVARNILEEMNFHVIEAEDGKIALEHCKKEMPDSVLLDWNMPVMDGMEFLIELRKLPKGGSPIVIFCTVENDPDHIRRAIVAGANEYIMKPFDGEILSIKFMQAGLIQV